MSTIKPICGTLIAVAVMMPTALFAQDLSEEVGGIVDRIRALNDQIADIQDQLVKMQIEQRNVMSHFVMTLREGDRGEQVRQLQEMLARDPGLYPEGLITGYFGQLTSAAVRRLQQRHGLEQVGYTGPRTRGILNKWFDEFATSTRARFQ